MRAFEGLLTVEEALACMGAGYDGPWFAPIVEAEGGGSVVVRERTSQGADRVWLLEMPSGDGDQFVYERDLAGFAPAPGYFLPMATAPRDGRTILVAGSRPLPAAAELRPGGSAYTLLALWRGDAWRSAADAALSGPMPEREFLGWQPVVTTKEVPDAT